MIDNNSVDREQVNQGARLALNAAPGEFIVSEQALPAVGIDGCTWQARTLELKGISQPVPVRVTR
jgi:class 3 adenylate cyclase